MKLPKKKQNCVRRIHYGRYLAAKLLKAGHRIMADAVEVVTTRLKDFGRKVDDAEEPIKVAIAHRDAVIDDIRESVSTFRLRLASRALHATRKAPYTAVFPDGIGYYTKASLEDINARYLELVERVEKALPEDDALRIEITGAVAAGLVEYEDAVKKVETTRRESNIVKTEYDQLQQQWESQMVKTYGELIAELGKMKAERFFPRNVH